MLPFYKKYWRTAFDIALIALTVYLIMFSFSYLYRIATPIFLSFLIFLCIEPLARRLNKLGMKKSIASGISILLFTLILLTAFSGAAYLITKQGTELVNNFPKYQEMLAVQIANLTEEVQTRFGNLPADLDLVQRSKDLIEGASSTLALFGKTVLLNIIGYVTSFSTFVFNFVVGIILAYFLSIEITTWKRTAEDKTPNTFKTAFSSLGTMYSKELRCTLRLKPK